MFTGEETSNAVQTEDQQPKPGEPPGPQGAGMERLVE